MGLCCSVQLKLHVEAKDNRQNIVNPFFEVISPIIFNEMASVWTEDHGFQTHNIQLFENKDLYVHAGFTRKLYTLTEWNNYSIYNFLQKDDEGSPGFLKHTVSLSRDGNKTMPPLHICFKDETTFREFMAALTRVLKQ